MFYLISSYNLVNISKCIKNTKWYKFETFNYIPYNKSMKYIKSRKYVEYVKKILTLDKYQQNEKVNNEICKLFAKYWIGNSNSFYNLDINKEEVGIIMGSVDSDHEVEMDVKAFNKIAQKHEEYKELIDFQLKITKTIQMLRDKDLPEVNCLCSLVSGKNVGLNLIALWEKELKERGHKKYQVFSDQNCNHEWYERNGFKLAETIKVDLDGLPSIKKKHKDFYIYKFYKTIK